MQKGILLLFMGLVLNFSLQAQDIEKISLQDAINIALENNYQLKQANNQLDLARDRVFSAKADFLPSLNGSLNGTQTVGQQFNNIALAYREEVSNSISGNISANITVFDGFNNILNLRQSRTNEEFEEQSLARTRETIIFTTASRYLQVLLDKELLQIAQEDLEASKKQLEQVKAQVEVGSRPTVDLYDQESIVANNELAVIQQENSLEFSKTRLVRILQIDPLENYEFIQPEINEDVDTQSFDLIALTQRALSSRADLRAQELLIQAREYDLQMSRSNLYPSLTARAGISTNYQDVYRGVDPETQERVPVSFTDQFFDQRITRFAAFSLNIPIFNNWNNRITIEQAKVNHKNARLDLEDQQYAVQEEVRQAYNDYTTYRKQLETTQKALRAAEKTYETQRQRYNVGSTTLIELSNANARYVQAQSDHVRALYNLIFQEKLLDYYTGRLEQNISFN